MLPPPALRVLASSLVLSAALVSAPAAAEQPQYSKSASAWTSGVQAKAMAMPKPDVSRTGREGSVGVGPFRQFVDKPVSSTASAAGVQQNALSKSKGIAWVGKTPKADGTFRVFGLVRTDWISKTTGGGESLFQKGRSMVHGAWSEARSNAWTGGKNPRFANGYENKMGKNAGGAWFATYKKGGLDERLAATFQRKSSSVTVTSRGNDESKPKSSEFKMAGQHAAKTQ